MVPLFCLNDKRWINALSALMAPLLFLLLLLSEAASGKIEVALGDDVILPCLADDSNINVVKWSRPDLEPDYVLLIRDEHLENGNQHPSFKDRVELRGKVLKDGDVSLTLKNVNINDTGTYECQVRTGDTQPIRTIILKVKDPDLKEETVRPGDHVILPCRADDSFIRAVEWSRPGLDPDTILFYRDGHLETDHQNPDFKDRVELVERDLKDGDLSLILKNVSRHDAGTYKCRVKTGALGRRKRDNINSIRTITSVQLQVADLTMLVRPGDDVILPCRAADSSISVVEWRRADLTPAENVLFYSDGHLESDDQNPSFKDRVELVNRDLKNGDVSLILKTVSINDTGTYKCRVKSPDFTREKRGIINSEPIRTVRLQVTDPKDGPSSPGGRDAGLELFVAGLVLAVAAVAVFGVLMYKRQKRPGHPDAAGYKPAETTP